VREVVTLFFASSLLPLSQLKIELFVFEDLSRLGAVAQWSSNRI
jgi:hypothetical protein